MTTQKGDDGTMQKKLVRHGNSWALVIDRPILDLLQWEETCEVEIVTDGKSLTLTKVSSARRGKKRNGKG